MRVISKSDEREARGRLRAYELTNLSLQSAYPCNLIGSQGCDLFTNRTIFCSQTHLFSANENGTVKQNNQSVFKVSLT